MATFVLTAFLFLPLALLGQRTYAAVDMLESTAPYRNVLDAPPAPASPIQTDQVESIPGPVAFFRAIRNGDFQLWDPNIAAGTPTGIFPFTGLLSLFSIGYLLAPAWYAVGLKVFLSLVFCQGFTYLLLRRLGASLAPSIVGAVAYAYTGANLVLIHRIGAVFLLPALLWATHRLLTTPSRRGIPILAVLVALTWFEGFPAGFVYCIYTVAAFAGWLAVSAERPRDRAEPGWAAVRNVIRRLASVLAGIVWGVGIASINFIPFVTEVLARGVLDRRQYGASAHLPSIQFFGLFDLSVTGPPRHGPWWTGLNPVESVSHVGMIVAAAVAAGLVAAVRGRLRLTKEGADAWPFFCALGCVGVLLNFVGTPMLSLAYRLPGIANNPINRSRFVIGLSASVLAGLTLDAWWAQRRGDSGRVAAPRRASLLTLAFLVSVALTFSNDLVEASYRASQGRELIRGFAVGLLVTCVAFVLAAIVRARTSVAPLALVGIVGLLFLQLALPLQWFTPQSPKRDFYTRQAGHAELERLLDGRYRFLATELNFYPNAAQLFDTPDLRGLALHSREFRQLVEVVNPTAFHRDKLKIILTRDEWNLGSPALDSLAVRYVAMGTNEMPYGQLVSQDTAWDRWIPANDVRGLIAEDVAPGPIAGLLLPLRTRGRCDGEVEVAVEHAGRLLDRAARPAFDLSGSWVSFGLTAQELVAGDRYRIRVAPTRGDCQVDVGVRSGLPADRAAKQVIVEDASQPVRLVATEQAWFYERPHAWPLVSAHGSWRTFSSRQEVLSYVATRPTDERDVAAVVGRAPARPPIASTTRVDEIVMADESVTFRATAAATSLVVVSQNLASGWSATIDGAPSKLLEVDGALTGLFVPPGVHRVALQYRPRAFVYGAGLSAVSLFSAAALLSFPRGIRPRRRAPSEP